MLPVVIFRNQNNEERKDEARNRKKERFHDRYGPWAVVTGALSGIGCAPAFLIAEAGENLVLVARSQSVLEQLARDISEKSGVECRVIASDGAVDSLVAATGELEVGLLVGAAGFCTSG